MLEGSITNSERILLFYQYLQEAEYVTEMIYSNDEVT